MGFAGLGRTGTFRRVVAGVSWLLVLIPAALPQLQAIREHAVRVPDKLRLHPDLWRARALLALLLQPHQLQGVRLRRRPRERYRGFVLDRARAFGVACGTPGTAPRVVGKAGKEGSRRHLG